MSCSETNQLYAIDRPNDSWDLIPLPLIGDAVIDADGCTTSACPFDVRSEVAVKSDLGHLVFDGHNQCVYVFDQRLIIGHENVVM